jgi:hypothetical protein
LKKNLKNTKEIQNILQKIRPWKDHFKSDLRSDQDHRQKNDLRSFKKIILKDHFQKITFDIFNFETDKNVTFFLYIHIVYLLF